MRVGVVDIGTNSMRLLVTDSQEELERWVEVTGLGRGVDRTGRLGDQEMEATLAVLQRFGRLLEAHRVRRRAAIATSATRDAANREQFLDRAEEALGVRPEVISGEREGRLAYAGATADLPPGDYLVCDIGGGSTEFVTLQEVFSVDIGSVRLTERALPDRPAPSEQLARAREEATRLLGDIPGAEGLEVIGVAGTWTSLAALDLELSSYDRERVHHHLLTRERLEALTGRLARMTVEETAALPALDPGRAPVILAGSVVALCSMVALRTEAVLVSERDTLDGLAMELVARTLGGPGWRNGRREGLKPPWA